MSDQAIKAARVYFRMSIIGLFVILLAYMLLAGRIDAMDTLRVMLAAIIAYLTGDTALMRASQNAQHRENGSNSGTNH